MNDPAIYGWNHQWQRVRRIWYLIIKTNVYLADI